MSDWYDEVHEWQSVTGEDCRAEIFRNDYYASVRLTIDGDRKFPQRFDNIADARNFIAEIKENPFYE